MHAPVPSSHLTLLYSRAKIQNRLQALAADIRHDYQGREIVIVCVLKGAFMFLADLVREMALDVRMSFVSVSSYGSGTSSSGTPMIQEAGGVSVERADVLIVEDILDTGLSMAALIAHLRDRSPRSIRLCALIDKRERRAVEISADYVGFELSRGFVVGYGIDYAERYRHLPAIHVLDRTAEGRS